MAQIDVLRVLINVPESDAPLVRSGASAVVTTQAFPKREFAGRITRTANAVDVSSRTMLVEVQVSNPKRVLLPGMFVQVRLLLNRHDPPLLIPGPSVIATSQGLRVAVLQNLAPNEPRHQSKPYPEEAKRIHLTGIQVGRDYGQEIEVVNGLQGWEHIVLNPGDEIAEGAIVRPVAVLHPDNGSKKKEQ